MPAQQMLPDGQALPHAPQLLTSLSSVAQPEAQQVWPPVHWMPQPPQFWAVVVLMH